MRLNSFTWASFFITMGLIVPSAYAQDLATNPPRTLHEAILTSIQKNPKTQAKDRLVEALHFQTQAAKDQSLPTVSLSCGYSNSSGQGGYQGKTPDDSSSNSRNCNAGISMNLYDGGANQYSAKAAEAQEEATRYRYNSTNPFIQNTKGSLAGKTLESYLNLVTLKETISEYEYENQYLNRVAIIAKSDTDKNTINSQIASINGAIVGIKLDLEQAKSQFKYFVTVEPADILDSLEMTIEKLRIPVNIEEAKNIAQEKNPDLKASDYDLEAAKNTTKSVRASLGPRVSLYANKSYNNSGDAYVYSGLPYQSNSSTVGVNLSIALGVSKFHSLDATAKREEAALADHDGALDDMNFQIKNYYEQLANAQTMLNLRQHEFELSKKSTEDILNQLNSSNPDPDGKLLTNALAARGNRASVFMQLYGMYPGILPNTVRLKFSIQQVTGTVFDEIQKEMSLN